MMNKSEKISGFSRNGFVPDHFTVCESDADAAHFFELRRDSTGPLFLEAGDLKLVLGASGEIPTPGKPCVFCSVDIIEIVATDEKGVASNFFGLSNVLLKRRWLHGSISIIGSTGWFRGREVCPRAHPGDGKLDCLQVSSEMTMRQRIRAIKMAKSAQHLPHPSLIIQQKKYFHFPFEKPIDLIVDYRPRGLFIDVKISVLERSLEVIVPVIDS